MGWLDELCAFCDLKPGFLSTTYICRMRGIELDEKSDLFKYGCKGGIYGSDHCPFYQKK